jgi:DNA-binding response OmpR family regulator
MRVLLAEDDPMIGASVRQGLRQDGFAVDWVETAALRSWRSWATHVRSCSTRLASARVDVLGAMRPAATRGRC